MQLSFIMPDINDPQRTKDAFDEIVKCVNDLNLTVNHEGMAITWVAEGTRLLVAREEGKCVGMAIMCFGRRWYDADTSASLILIEGNYRKEMIEYLRQACEILGVSSIYLQKEPGDDYKGDEVTMLKMRVRQ